MANWHQLAVEYYAAGLRPCDIARKIEEQFGLTNMYNTVKCYLYKVRKRAEKLEKTIKDTPRVVVQNQEPTTYDTGWDGTKVIRFGLVTDTHFGSKYAQITHLHRFYDFLASEGITTVYHAGDITDGLKMRPGHEYELYDGSADGQVKDVVENYPKREGVTTYFITGNHDASLYKHVGFDIGAAIAEKRSDMVYLGRDCAVVTLAPNCTLELRHPWDGIAYALTYKIQKMIEAMESDSKPNILVVGHYHKQGHFMYRNVHAILAGCFEAQTPFLRGKGISATMGGYLVTIHVDDKGTIQRIIPEWIPCYASIKDDYKNYKH